MVARGCGIHGVRDTALLNGELVATAPGSQPGGETRFVIGNVGENNLISFYRGQIRSVRISEGERYNGEFEPGKLESDKGTLFFIDDSATIRGDELLNADGHMFGRVERY